MIDPERLIWGFTTIWYFSKMFQQPADRQQLESSDQQTLLLGSFVERENIKFHNKAIYFRTNTLLNWVGRQSFHLRFYGYWILLWINDSGSIKISPNFIYDTLKITFDPRTLMIRIKFSCLNNFVTFMNNLCLYLFWMD